MAITDLLKKTYSGKKVFLTGHTGFKGSWMLSWLHLLGAEVKGYALAPENEGDLYNQINGDSLCTSVIADIRDQERVKKEMLSFRPDFVFHLAAQPLVRLSYDIPVDTFSVNAMGTAHVLDALRNLDSPCVAVMITTDKVYHNMENGHHYKETDKLGGYDPYSASKACAELVVDSFRNSFFNPSKYELHQKSISSARAGNVIGGGDWAKDRIIPDTIRALVANKPITIRNPKAIRPWQHVLEPLCGYLVLGYHQAQDPVTFATGFNFGPYMDDTLSVRELAEEAIAVWGHGSHNADAADHSAMHEAGLLSLDITKALDMLEWKPVMDTHRAIATTVEWYRQNLVKGEDARKLVESDINQFIAL